MLHVEGAIGPAVQDYIKRGISDAEKKSADAIVLRLNTPGGLETSMRGINEAILSAKIPVITYVAPNGARAASAGTFILYASHVAAMAPGTNVGAASPVSIQGGGDEKKSQDKTMTKKATNDAVAYIRSLANLRGRNANWGEKAVRDAASLPAHEALNLKVIDYVANSMPELMQQINGKEIPIGGGKKILKTDKVTLQEIKPDWRFEFLSVITDPSVAYILLLIGIYGIFFEFSNPGFVLPGVIGTIALLIALYAFQLLPINYVGLALILAGLTFMILEVFVSSFGVLAIGGAIAFIVGSIMLLDASVPGYSIAWPLIVTMSVISIVFFFMVISLAISSYRKNIVSGKEALIGSEGVVLEVAKDMMTARVNGEIWQIRSAENLKPGDLIRVISLDGLTLQVERVNQEKYR